MRVSALSKSKLVEGAAEAQRPTRWWWAAILAIAIGVIVVGQVVVYLYGQLVPDEPGSLSAQVMELFTNAGTLLALWMWVRFKERRAFSSVGFRSPQPWKKFLWGVLLGVGMISLVVGILVALGEYRLAPTPPAGFGGWQALIPVMSLALVWCVQSSTEETVMRGYLLQTAARQLPGWLAILLPGLIFSAMHFAAETPAPIAGLNIVIFALLVSFLALKQGSIWMACGIHMGWNWFQGNVFTLPVSGNVYNNGIFHFIPSDSALIWLSGGAFGPENSLVVTTVWGIAALLAYSYFSREPNR